MKEKYPGYLKGTEEEMTATLASELNMEPKSIDEMEMSEVQIYMLIMEKKAFTSWCVNIKK